MVPANEGQARCPGAITAVAHKLARVLYSTVKYRKPFDPDRLGHPALRQARKENALRRTAEELGYALQPIQAVAVSQPGGAGTKSEGS